MTEFKKEYKEGDIVKRLFNRVIFVVADVPKNHDEVSTERVNDDFGNPELIGLSLARVDELLKERDKEISLAYKVIEKREQELDEKDKEISLLKHENEMLRQQYEALDKWRIEHFKKGCLRR